MGFKQTGRMCEHAKCRGAILRDSVLDWESELPPDELAAAERHADAADLALCLGTSLQISPACNLPLRTLRAGASHSSLHHARADSCQMQCALVVAETPQASSFKCPPRALLALLNYSALKRHTNPI